MTEIKPRRGLRRSGPVPARTRTRTAVNRAIVRKLKQNDRDPIALLARVATDEELPMKLRFRAANNLTKLVYAPPPRAVPVPQPEKPRVDVAAIIRASWAKHDAEEREKAEAEKKAAAERRAAREAEPPAGEEGSSAGTEAPATPADGPVAALDCPIRTGQGRALPDDDWQYRMRNWPRYTVSD